METFEVGKIVFKARIDDKEWVFKISDVFHLSDEEYARNEAYNDTLGNWEPEKELPENSLATIEARSSEGDVVTLKWSSGNAGVFPHIHKKGWSKGLFVKLNQILRKWRFPNA